MILKPQEMHSSNDYDEQAALAAVHVILKQHPRITTQELTARLYTADKQHLSAYGRTITGDTHTAHPNGAAPTRISEALSSLTQNPQAPSTWLAQELQKSITLTGNTLAGPATIGTDDLSDSDIECLQNTEALANQDEAWRATPTSEIIPTTRIATTLANSKEVLEYLADPYP